MNDKVLIKGNKYGFKVVISEDAVLEEAYKELAQKLEAGRAFFGKGEVSLEIIYDKVDKSIEEKVLDIIKEHSDLKVFCLVDENMKVVEPNNFTTIEKNIKEKKEIIKEDLSKKELVTKLDDDFEYARFFQGTLRSGQEIKSDRSIVLLGDVNAGAKVVSTGNIVVLGKIRGFAHAGATGKKNASIFALSLEPTQVRIAEYIARTPKSFEGKEPSLAFVEDERIVIDTIDKGLFKDFILLK